jgi:hypothetical protein
MYYYIEVTILRQPWAWAHFAISIAGPSPLFARQIFQQVWLVVHFFWQSWRVETHLGSFWQAVH